MREKLRTSRGETLVEVLASVLVCTLSIMLLLGAVTASTNIDLQAQEADEEYYAALTKAERQDPDTDKAEKVSGFSVQVVNTTPLKPGETALPPLPMDCVFYGSERLFSYAAKQEKEPSPSPDPVPEPGGEP